MKYHALFVIFEKSGKILNCRPLQIIGGALRVNWPKIKRTAVKLGHRERVFKMCFK